MKKRLSVALILSLIFMVTSGLTCALFEYQVEYRVTGSAGIVDVTYANEGGGTSQESSVSVPWSYSFEGKPGQFVYISAQNAGRHGTVTVTIYRNNSVFKTSTSSGEYVIATASGTL